MSNTYKHDDFVNEPMRSKRVTDLPGIGETYGDRLHRRGYRNVSMKIKRFCLKRNAINVLFILAQARQVFGEYLAMGGNKREFREFLSETTGANSRQTRDCYEAMRRWDRNFMQ